MSGSVSSITPHRLTHDGVVVDQEDADAHGARSRPGPPRARACRGPGALSISSRPPHASARSRMVSRPKWPRAGARGIEAAAVVADDEHAGVGARVAAQLDRELARRARACARSAPPPVGCGTGRRSPPGARRSPSESTSSAHPSSPCSSSAAPYSRSASLAPKSSSTDGPELVHELADLVAAGARVAAQPRRAARRLGLLAADRAAAAVDPVVELEEALRPCGRGSRRRCACAPPPRRGSGASSRSRARSRARGRARGSRARRATARCPGSSRRTGRRPAAPSSRAVGSCAGATGREERDRERRVHGQHRERGAPRRSGSSSRCWSGRSTGRSRSRSRP